MSVVITGANRGLGLELFLEAVRRGHYVYALTRNVEGEQRLLAEVAERGIKSDQFLHVSCDMQSESDVENFARQLRAEEVSLTSIINSAAILNARKTDIERLDMADAQISFDINLFGPMRIVKHLLPLLQDEHGSILNISSEAGSITHAYAGDYPYSLTKCALNLFSEQLKRKLAVQGIEVWSIHPGWMHTDMGGPAAPLAPADSAKGIIDIMERKVAITTSSAFIDYKGQAMDI